MSKNGIAETMVGARALTYVGGRIVGSATSISFSVAHGVEAIHTLGRYESQENVTTSYEAVPVTLNGYRIIGKGPYHKENGQSVVTAPGEIFKNVEFDIHVEDRETKKTVLRITRCRATGLNADMAAKATQSYTATFLGIIMQDESIEENVLFNDPGNPAPFQ